MNGRNRLGGLWFGHDPDGFANPGRIAQKSRRTLESPGFFEAGLTLKKVQLQLATIVIVQHA
jgi:hypothetical protein